MSACTNCGAGILEGVRFCSTCGTPTTTGITSNAEDKIIEAKNYPAALWHITYATGQRGGPFTEDDIRGLIARQELKLTDSIIAEGGTTWVPITQSPFATFILRQASVNRLAASTCPRCGNAMAVILRRSSKSKLLLLCGFLTIWLFGFGVIFLILGYITGRNPSPRYECPHCKYRAR
jgi:predicted RNA-binding Zn-ribbon protein involved in translation (DUF1610 family)